jgi:hypothetical protein
VAVLSRFPDVSSAKAAHPGRPTSDSDNNGCRCVNNNDIKTQVAAQLLTNRRLLRRPGFDDRRQIDCTQLTIMDGWETLCRT